MAGKTSAFGNHLHIEPSSFLLECISQVTLDKTAKGVAGKCVPVRKSVKAPVERIYRPAVILRSEGKVSSLSLPEAKACFSNVLNAFVMGFCCCR